MNARSLCSDLVILEWKDVDGWNHELAAVLEDISPRGACLQIEEAVPVDTAVQISHGRHWQIGCRVVYCEYREIGYFLGLEFSAGEDWNRGAFNPQHLLDLTDLMHRLNAHLSN